MFLKLITIFFFFFNLLFQSQETCSQSTNFTYNDGFNPPTDLSLQGITTVTPNGLLKLTNYTVQKTGHAFYTKPIRFKDSPNGTVYSFSTTFVFAIHSQIPILSGHGIAFVVAPNPSLPYATASQYIVFAVELDTIRSTEFNDTDDNHVGIDINSLKSERTSLAGWWDEKGQFKNLSLISRKPMQVWVDYDGGSHKIDVTMAPFNEDKPRRPLVFRVNGEAPPLALSRLPKLPRFEPKRISDFFKIGMPLISLFLIFCFIFLVCFLVRRRRKFAEEMDDWEKEFGKNRFRFKDLYYATKGFKEKDLLGTGGFGSVYKEVTLNWKQRIKVILGVASGLFYLHEEWEQVVIHRDVKASNVLLDGELNGRLGDFGLARLYDHGSDPQTTHVVGTLGYLAPEHTRTGRATTATDVFAFGAFLLEVTCGRRPIEIRHEIDETFLLVEWVFGLWNKGNILDAKDPNMGYEYDEKEVEMVLKLGLLCSHPDPRARPSMRQVLQYLRGDAKLPDLSPLDFTGSGMILGLQDGFSELGMSYSSSVFKGFTGGSIADSLLSGGR
ncbi:BnaA03g17380D [Brassica napus]|uniref:non-specific serine/threonine protein kinase n=1 Tax=Brassica napus TaxID=3708 RepID=A0A078F7T0_BRANA|nr:BnaA03g17380D [Brassica napus]